MCDTKIRIAKNISYLEFLTGKECVSCNKLTIADFQRNYVWEKKNIVSLFVSYKETNENESLYLGNIVIQRSPEGNIGGDLVVDGQQRLITLSLIVNAINVKKDKEKILLYPDSKEPRIQFYRKKSNDIYNNILGKGEIIEKDLDQTQKNFIKINKIIIRELKKIDDIKKFYEKIKKTEFVVIKCPTTHDVNQLFESLNSKGKKLSVIELTKNAILLNADIKEDLPKRINDKWEELERSFEDKEANLIWFDKFFRHRWFCIGGYVSNNNLFDSIKKNIKDGKVEQFTDKLIYDSKIYLSLRKGKMEEKNNYSDEIGDPEWRIICLIIEQIKKMNVDQVYSVLLALIKYGDINKSYFSDLFFNDVKNLWQFLLLIRYSKKFNPNSYEKKFASFCKEINNIPEGKTFISIRNNFFKDIFSSIPREEDFIEIINLKIKCSDLKEPKENNNGKINIKNINFNEDRDVIRSLLLYYISDGSRIESSTEETIEHIIPNGSISKWKNINEKYKERIENIIRYQLGNLTILEKKLNSDKDVGNEIFDVKFEKGYNLSGFKKNNKLKEEYCNEFNSENPEDAVIKRGKQIGGYLYNKLKKYKKI